MDMENFNTHLTPLTYGLIALWAKEASLNPVSENRNICSMYSDLVGELPITLNALAATASGLYEDFEAIECESEHEEILVFIFNLIRVDMHICHLVKCRRELNPYASLKLCIQAHNLVKDHVLPMLNPEYENPHGVLSEMGVLKAWNTLKRMMLDKVQFEQIVILLDADTTATLLKILVEIEEVILNENSDYLESFDTHI